MFTDMEWRYYFQRSCQTRREIIINYRQIEKKEENKQHVIAGLQSIHRFKFKFDLLPTRIEQRNSQEISNIRLGIDGDA